MVTNSTPKKPALNAAPYIHSFRTMLSGCNTVYLLISAASIRTAAIVTGFKQKITQNEAMTGREFCDLLEIDYDEIVAEQDQSRNVRFFLRELINVEQVRVSLRDLLRERNA